MTGERKRYLAEFKARVALEALRGELTVSQLATKQGVHQTLIGDWKRQAMDGMAAVFSGKADAAYSVDDDQPFRLIVITVHGDPDHGVHPARGVHGGHHDAVPTGYH